MTQWLDCIILLIVGSTVTAIIFIGVWPNEHTFDEGVRCSVIAISNLRNKPDLVVDDIYIEAQAVKRRKQSFKLRKARRRLGYDSGAN